MRKFENWKRAIPSLIILAVLLASMAAGVTYAKYVTDAKLEGSVKITANLGNIEVIESKAQRNPDGSYKLLSETTTQNTYYLLPGLDIPKNPFVKITGKSVIEAYVFLEVLTNIKIDPDGLSYALTGDWTLINGLSGINGGPVYYCLVNNTGDINIPILVDNQIVVSQHLKTATDQSGNNIYPSGSVYLNFYTCMGQTDAGNTPADVYNALFKSTP